MEDMHVLITGRRKERETTIEGGDNLRERIKVKFRVLIRTYTNLIVAAPCNSDCVIMMIFNS